MITGMTGLGRVLPTGLDVQPSQAGLQVLPGPVGEVHCHVAQERGGDQGAGGQPSIYPEELFYHKYLKVPYEHQVVNYHKHQQCFVGLINNKHQTLQNFIFNALKSVNSYINQITTERLKESTLFIMNNFIRHLRYFKPLPFLSIVVHITDATNSILKY